MKVRSYIYYLQENKDGAQTEHAVAENASSGNVTDVFRSKRNLNDDGSIWVA